MATMARMGTVMTIITVLATTGMFGGRMLTYSGIMITADSTTILDGEGLRAEVPEVGFMGVEEAFTEGAVVVVMEEAEEAMGDNVHAAEIL
jgi:hypothetical protein